MAPIKLQRKGFKVNKMTQNEILTRGYKALKGALRVVGMIRFIQHFNEGKGDYTKERHQWLYDQSVEDILQEMNKWKNVNDIAEYYEREQP
jgi:hypothetical protein